MIQIRRRVAKGSQEDGATRNNFKAWVNPRPHTKHSLELNLCFAVSMVVYMGVTCTRVLHPPHKKPSPASWRTINLGVESYLLQNVTNEGLPGGPNRTGSRPRGRGTAAAAAAS